MNKTTEEKYMTVLEWAESIIEEEVEDRLKAAEVVRCYQASQKVIDKKLKPYEAKAQKAFEKHKESVQIKKSAVEDLSNANSSLKEKLVAWYERNQKSKAQARQESDETWKMILALEEEGEVEQAALLKEEVARKFTAEEVVLPGASFQERWDFEIEDEAVIPRKYLSADPKKIREAVQSVRGVVKIPGILAKKRYAVTIYKDK
tara:strand:- start:11983 stop:12594 length:612 start_codon:yes stop_codon:yes gene_type:complete